jgi:hypothetical protein
MKAIFGFFIFCLVLFLYLHIQFHLKTGDDLEMYEFDSESKDKFEEICNLRQPVLFSFDSEKIVKTSSLDYLASNYGSFEVKVRNAKDQDYSSEIYMPLPVNAAIKLFSDDTEASYFSEKNNDFLQETGLIKHMQYNDVFIRPPMVSNCNYDVMMGSNGTNTPFRYEVNFRNFFLITEGKVIIKLAPPQNSKYLYPERDYENFEFRSPVNPWKVQPQYSADFDKMKCLDVILKAGQTINIPAYWWYSIQFEKNSCVACFRYRTYMNNAAIVPHIAMHALQLQNVKREVVKKRDITELNSKNSTEPKNDIEIAFQIEHQPLDIDSKEVQGAESSTSINNSAL